MLGQEVRNERILDYGKVPQINVGAWNFVRFQMQEFLIQNPKSKI